MKIVKGGWAVVDNDTHFSQWIELTGEIDHGQKIAERFTQWFGPGDTAIDVGACLGDHTVPYAKIVGSAGQVFAFEPNPEAFECLAYNTRNYPQVKCFNCGISDIEENIGFVRNENLGASYLEQGTGNPVHIRPLDSFTEYDFSKTKFIKMDVEGWELKALMGSESIINTYKPIIMLEIAAGHQARYGKTPQDIYDWLKAHRYDPGEVLNEPQYDMVAYPKK